MTYEIRPARPADQTNLRRIVRHARLGPFGLDWPNFLVAERAGEIIGVAQVKAHRDGSRELASLAVTPDNQGQGIGTALVQALIGREEGILFLFCGSRLSGYYQRFGFEEVAPDLLSTSIRRLLRLINISLWLLNHLSSRRLSIIAMRREQG